jgi:ribosomal subunit interface protein
MQVKISGREIRINERVRNYIERRIHFALERLAWAIRKVHVQLRDLNGPRGGIDKSCQVRIALAPATMLVVEQRSASAYAAIDSAMDKAAVAIVRRVEKKQERIRTRSNTRGS